MNEGAWHLLSVCTPCLDLQIVALCFGNHSAAGQVQMAALSPVQYMLLPLDTWLELHLGSGRCSCAPQSMVQLAAHGSHVSGTVFHT